MRTGMVGKNLIGTIARPLFLVLFTSLNCSTSFLMSQYLLCSMHSSQQASKWSSGTVLLPWWSRSPFLVRFSRRTMAGSFFKAFATDSIPSSMMRAPSGLPNPRMAVFDTMFVFKAYPVPVKFDNV